MCDSQPPADLIPRVIKRLVHGSGYASDPTEWSKRFLGREGRELCDAVLSALDQVPGLEPERTTLFLYHGHPLHIPALIRLGLALSGRSPIVLNLYHLHQAYGLHRPKRVPGLRELLQYTRELRRAANVHLFVDSERLGKMIEADTNEKFEVLPFFSTTGDIASPATSNPGSTRPVCLAYPTWFPARDKGFDLVIALAERLRGRNLDILARRNEGQPSDVCLPTKASLAGGLSILPGFLSADRYKEFLSRSDVMLIPYSACEFLTRTSSAVADGVLFAKPMVGTAGTWIGDQIESLGGGVTFNDGDEADFARAVEKVVDGLEGYQKNLLTHRDHWLKKNSLSAFVRRMTSLQRTELSPRATSIWMARLFFFRYRYRLASLAAANTHRLFFISRWLGGKSGSLQLRYYGGLRNFRKLPAIVWRTRGVTEVELRLDAHDGFLLERGGSRGSIWTAVLIPEGAQIFLQDVSNGKPLLPQHTLDRLTFHVDAKAPRSRRPIFWRRWHVRKAQNFLQAAGRVSRSRTPDWIVRFVRTILSMGTGELAIRLAPIEPKNTGEATVSWSCEGVSSVEVLACGKVFARGGSVGSATTGKWVTDGMTFTLVDANSRRLLPAFRVMDIVTIGASPEKYPVTELGRARSKAATAYQSLSAVDFLRFLVGMRWLSRRPTAQLRSLDPAK